MSKMNYDKSEPNFLPIVISIFATLVLVFVITFGVLYYFKGSLADRTNANENLYGKAFDLKNLNEWETNYLNKKGPKKVTIDEAINITLNNYNN